MDEPLNSLIVNSDLSTWHDFECWRESLPKSRLAYRGQRDSKWNLETTLERFSKQLQNRLFSLQSNMEARLSSEFKRAAHHFDVEPLYADHEFDWMALMQHYGAPTRLLDWTESGYIALFFAIEQQFENTVPEVYAIDLDQLELAMFNHWAGAPSAWIEALTALSSFKKWAANPEERTKDLNAYLSKYSECNLTGVVAARPFKLNYRLAVQRGLFIHPLSLKKSFQQQLFDAIAGHGPEKVLFRARLIDISRREFLERLNEMNVQPASLFPGLDGYARALRIRYEIERLGAIV